MAHRNAPKFCLTADLLVNAHLAAAAGPVVEGRGELLPGRLKQDI